MRTQVLFSSAFVVTAAAVAPAFAAEPGVIRARLDLDKVEKRLPGLKQGDVRSANRLIASINRAKSSLRKCKDRQAADWIKQAQRAEALDKKVRAALGQTAPPKATPQPSPSPSGGGEVPGSGEPDAITKRAKAILDEVEAALKTLKPGQMKQANALINKINSARTTLSKTRHRSTQMWRESVKRADVLDQRVRQQASGKGAQGGGLKPEEQARLNASPKIPPIPADQPPMSPKDRLFFQRHFNSLARTYVSIAASDPRAFAGKRADPTMNRLKMLEGKVASLRDQEHPRTKWVKQVLPIAKKLLAERAAEGTKLEAERLKKRQAEIDAANEQLKSIEAFFDPKSFNCELKPPYGKQRVQEWIDRLKGYQAMAPRGQAMLAKFLAENPEWESLARVKKLKHLFGKGLVYQINRGINRTVEWYDTGAGKGRGPMLQAYAWGQDLIKQTEKQGLPEKWLKDDAWVKKSLDYLDKGIEAGEGLILFKKQWRNQDDPETAAGVAKFRALRTKLDAAAKRVLAQTRMPKAASSDSGLLAQAAKTLKAKGYGPFKRLVISSAMTSKTERKSDARREGDYLRIWKWTEKWDQYQVAAAEQIDGQYRIVYYTLKYIHIGPPWKTTKAWYVSGRADWQRILEENIDK